MVYAGGMKPWWGIDHLRFGIIGAGASLISMVVVSLVITSYSIHYTKLYEPSP